MQGTLPLLGRWSGAWPAYGGLLVAAVVAITVNRPEKLNAFSRDPHGMREAIGARYAFFDRPWP